MNDTPRRWFQIHLSTAMVLMFVIAALMGLNLCGGSRFTPSWFNGGYESWSGLYGWPIGINGFEPPEHISIVIDFCVNGALLVLAYYSSEFFIRRREARKP